MKKFMFITLLLILFSRSINADVDFITDAMLESAVNINESEVIFNDNGDTIGIKINIEFDFCYYNYRTVVGSERMYVPGYIDSND